MRDRNTATEPNFRKSLSKCRILSPKNSYLSISHVNSSNTAASLDRSITSVPTNDGSFYIQSNCVYIPNQFEPLLDTNGSCHFTASRRITFVGSTCALPSGLLVSVVSTDYILASDHTTQISKQRVSSTFAISDVHSKLNYCNSFYSHLLNSRINRIQQIQNSLAHTVAKVPTFFCQSYTYQSIHIHLITLTLAHYHFYRQQLFFTLGSTPTFFKSPFYHRLLTSNPRIAFTDS